LDDAAIADAYLHDPGSRNASTAQSVPSIASGAGRLRAILNAGLLEPCCIPSRDRGADGRFRSPGPALLL